LLWQTPQEQKMRKPRVKFYRKEKRLLYKINIKIKAKRLKNTFLGGFF